MKISQNRKSYLFLPKKVVLPPCGAVTMESPTPFDEENEVTSMNTDRDTMAENIRLDWEANPRWNGITRDHTAEDVVRLRGSVQEEHTLARRGAEKLWGTLK